MRHSWIACTALLAACFTDSGALPTTGAASTAAATSTTTTGEPATTTTTTGDVTTGGTTTGDATTGVDATTMSLTSGATTGGTTTGDATTDTTAAGTTGMIDIPIPGCDPLYFNDFTQDDGGLIHEGGGNWTWNQGAGELTLVSNGGSASAWIPGATWTDFVAYTRVRFDDTTGYASLRARGEPNKGNFYYASPTVGDQRLVVGVNAGGQANNKANAPVQLAPNTWYLLRFDVVGQDLSAQIEGVGAKFADGQFVEGTVGIGGFSIGTFSFDWLLVCKP